MADMTLKWEAHDKNVVAELEKMNKAMEGLREQNKKLSQESKQHHEEAHGFLQEQTHELTSMAMSYVSIEKAIDVVVDGYREWMELLDEAAKKHRDFTQDVMKQLTMAGDAAHADDIAKWASHGSGTKEQMMSALAGVTNAMPEASLSQRQALASQVAIQAPTGISMEAAGGGAGTLARFAPGKSADDVQDINMLLMQKLRGGQDRLTNDAFMRGVGSLIDSGAMGFEEALGMGGLAVSKNQKLGFMTKLGELATASSQDLTKDLKPGEAPNPEQVLKSQLAGMSPKERIAAVMGDHQMAVAGLGNDAAFQLGRLPKADRERWQQSLVEAQANNIGSRIEGTDTEVGKQVLAESSLRKQKQELEEKLGPRQALLKMAAESYQTGMTDQYGAAGMMLAKSVRGVMGAGEFLGGKSAQESDIEQFSREKAVDPEIRELLREHIEALKDNTRARGGVNVDAHGE
jgi:hypothetical protein